MADKKLNLSFAIVIIAAIIALGAAYFFSTASPDQGDENILAEAPAAAEAPADTAATEEAAAEPSQDGLIDVDAALADRILGNPNAPVRISEHASLTCGHCGHFHQETFGKFKEAYIDTGKAYVVFSDFPLNAPALHASMVARCLPADQYYPFTKELFEEQDKWAYEASYMTFLKAKAEKFGLDADHFKACLDSKALQDGIVARVTAAQKQWGINSTPSFVINNKKVISGGMDFEHFSQAVDAAASENDRVAPDQEPAAGSSEPAQEAPGAE